jgi:hypothetical protein
MQITTEREIGIQRHHPTCLFQIQLDGFTGNGGAARLQSKSEYISPILYLFRIYFL